MVRFGIGARGWGDATSFIILIEFCCCPPPLFTIPYSPESELESDAAQIIPPPTRTRSASVPAMVPVPARDQDRREGELSPTRMVNLAPLSPLLTSKN